MISLIGSCVRIDKWEKIYRDLSKSKIGFEFIFAGPKKPTFKLPSNFKYIYANVKPTQCWSIAAKKATGEIISLFGDDIQLSEGFLDNIYECYLQNDKKAVITPNIYYHNDWHLLAKDHFLVSHNSSTPNIPQGLAFYEKELFLKLNGSDKRFTASLGDYDLYLRSRELGCYLVFCETVWQRHEASQEDNENFLYRNYGKADRLLLYDFWIKDGKFSEKRLSPFQPFCYDNTIYKINQSPGIWKERII